MVLRRQTFSSEKGRNKKLEVRVGNEIKSIDITHFPLKLDKNLVGKTCIYKLETDNAASLQLGDSVYYFNPNKRDSFYVADKPSIN